MADQILSQVQDVIEGQIDFEGQKQAESITTGALAVVGAIAFVVGYVLENVYIMLWVGLGGTLLTFLAVVPPWPIYNKNPERWLPMGTDITGTSIQVDGKKIN